MFLCLYSSILISQNEWNKQDSIRLRKILDDENELQINQEAKYELDQIFIGSPLINEKSKILIDITLPKKYQMYNGIMNNHMKTFSSPKLPSISSSYFKNNMLRIKSNVDYTHPRFLLQRNTNISIKLKGRLGYEIYGGYDIARKRSVILPVSAFPVSVGMGLSYRMRKNIKLNMGVDYSYNIIKKRWEYIYSTSISIEF